MNRFTRIISLISVIAAVCLLPSAAQAMDNDTGPAGDGGCHYTDSDGYDIPIDDGQDVFVDGKIVSCRGGTIIVTTAPLSVSPGGGKVISIKDIVGKATGTRVTLAQRLKAVKLQHTGLDQLRATGFKRTVGTVGAGSRQTDATCQKFADAAEKALDEQTSRTSRTTDRALVSLTQSFLKAGQAVGCSFQAKA